jgi:hypothetical protein
LVSLSQITLAAKLLGMNKTPSAEELHKMIMRKRVTYEQIRRLDPPKFHDLE